jgi:RsmE family RNA methyltransferase
VNLILLLGHELSPSGEARLSGPRAAHLIHVLGAAPGQTVRVGLLDGPIGTGTVVDVQGEEVSVRCAFESTPPPAPRVDLLLALPRPKVMRRLWAQIAALGAGQIILTNAERVERHYFDTHMLEEATYRPLMIEGLQQARDTRLPRVSIHRQFKILIEDHLDGLTGDALRIAAEPDAPTSAAATAAGAGNRRVLLAVGPEGGWNAFELALLQAHGFQLAGLGPRTLRLDTACVALLAIVHSSLKAC